MGARKEQRPFEISYLGVTVKVTPILNGADMQCIISLPTRKMVIEMALDPETICYCQEVPGGRTPVAEEIGAIIERKDL